MKITYSQLITHLKKNLLPVYLITGNEPLLIQEARDAIRRRANQQGFSELERFDVNKDFDWHNLVVAGKTLSLFCNKKVIEIKLHHKPSASNAKIFSHYLEEADPNKIVLITTEKLDATAQKANWVEIIHKIGVIVNIWPMDISQCKQWVETRLQENNLSCHPDALQFLIEQTEGNLLALAQEIEKLKLLFKGRITLNDLVTAIADNARFDIFHFMDIVLQGNSARIIRVIQKMRAEAIEPTLLLWAITREIRSLIHIIVALKNKSSWEMIVKKFKIWDKRQALIKRVINLHNEASLHKLLVHATRIDHTIKGLQIGNIWNEIEMLALRISNNNSLSS